MNFKVGDKVKIVGSADLILERPSWFTDNRGKICTVDKVGKLSVTVRENVLGWRFEWLEKIEDKKEDTMTNKTTKTKVLKMKGTREQEIKRTELAIERADLEFIRLGEKRTSTDNRRTALRTRLHNLKEAQKYDEYALEIKL